jgi:hypothetical protein
MKKKALRMICTPPRSNMSELKNLRAKTMTITVTVNTSTQMTLLFLAAVERRYALILPAVGRPGQSAYR